MQKFDNATPNTKWQLQLRYLLPALAIMLASVVLVGWITNLAHLTQVRSELAAMVPSTAILLICCAIVLLLHNPNRSKTAVRVNLALTATVLVLACTDQFMFFVFGGMGIDERLLGNYIDFQSQRMSAMTALNYTLFASAYLVTFSSNPRITGLFQFLATTGLILTLVGLVGHMFDAGALYSVFVFSAKSVLTSLGFLFLFVGLLLRFTDLSWMQTLLGEGQGSVLARRMALPIVITPLLLSYGALMLSNAGILNANFRLSLIAILSTLVLFAGLLVLARSQNASIKTQNQTLDELRQTVRDRDLLLSEVYHRVKNNLQQINALLFIQTQSLKNKEAIDALNAMSGRIESLGVVQSLLLEAPTRTDLNIREFLSELCQRLEGGLGGELSHTKVTCRVEDHSVGLDQAITLGLIVNELISNAFKYAFNGITLGPERRGEIRVAFDVSGNVATLNVSDNGRGLGTDGPAELPMGGSGSSIVAALTSQLGGQLEIESSEGLAITISMPHAGLGE